MLKFKQQQVWQREKKAASKEVKERYGYYQNKKSQRQ